MRAGSVEAVACPRCERPPVVSHDEVLCLVHGQVHEPVRAWEAQATGDMARAGKVRTVQPVVGHVPFSAEEREWWRLEALGLPVPAPVETGGGPEQTGGGPGRRPETFAEYLQWVADRVSAGKPVGVEVVRRELGVGGWFAEQVMGGAWPALVRRAEG